MAVAGALAVAALAFFWVPTALPPASAPAAARLPESAATITVHVSGEVGSPGLVAVPAASRIADAIAAAGGATPEADITAINLAAAVRDGEQIVVPATNGPDIAQVDDGLVHLNSATQAELETIPGVGPVLAGRILAAREQSGGFDAIEDLLDVSGIGEARLASFRDLVVVP